MRLTIGRKLTLGIGVVLLLFVAMGLVAWRDAGFLNSTLKEITDREEPTSATAYEMEVNIVATGFSVLGYLHDRDPRHLEAIAQNYEDYEAFRAEYAQLAETERERQLGVNLDDKHDEFKLIATELIAIEDDQAETVTNLLQNLAELDTLVGQIQTSASSEDRQAQGQLQAALKMETDTNGIAKALGNYLRTHEAQYEEQVYRDEQDFYQAFDQYSILAVSPQEQQLANEVFDLFEDSVELSKVIIDLDKAKEAGLAHFVTVRRELSAVLEDGIRASTREDLTAAEEDADQAASRIKKYTIVFLITGLAFGIVVSVATTRNITKPVNSLVSAIRAVAKGDLHARVKIESNDELGVLAESFNRMTEDLQSTTVSKDYVDRMIRSMTDTLVVISSDGSIEAVNPATCSLLGYKEVELIGRPITQILGEKDSHQLGSQATESGSVQHLETSYLAKDGRQIPVLFSASAMLGEDGAIQGMVCLAQDITERKRAEETIKHLAYHDPLTGLPNRRLFQDRLIVALAQADRGKQGLALMSIDLDRFKLVNDTLGHAAGDQLLRAVGERLRGLIRGVDTIARVGGDEFMLLAPEVDGEGGASIIAEKILKAFNAPFHFDGQDLHITASIGISTSLHGSVAETLLQNADAALYRAKERGRNNYQLNAQATSSKPSERLALENSLHRALERGEFEVRYQLQANVHTLQIIGAEALVRWHHPRRGLLLPDEFIAAAEDTGLIEPLGEWVLRTACAQNKAWQESGLAPLRIAVNFSPRQFQQGNLFDTVVRALKDTGLAPEYLRLEITERVVMQDIDFAIAVLQDLRQMGVEISIDDFGTGYSSLNYLKRLPVDELKIDRDFVRDITVDPHDAAIVSAIVVLAQGLNLRVLAEGVETQEQLDILKEQQCYHIQGFLLGNPVPCEVFEKILAKGKGFLPSAPTLKPTRRLTSGSS